MSTPRRAAGLVLAGAILVGVSSCRDGPTEPKGRRLAVEVGAVTLMIGEADTLAATVSGADGKAISAVTITWTALDPRVASVSTGGVVTGVAAGETRVIAGSATLADTVAITVSEQVTASGAVGPAGGTVTLPSGVAVELLAQQALTLTTVRLIETPARGASATADSSRRLVLEVPGASPTAPVSVRLSWPSVGTLPAAQSAYLVAESASGALSFGVLQEESAPADLEPMQSANRPSALLPITFLLTGAVTTIRSIIVAAQTPENCASTYQLRDTTSEAAPDPDIAIVLIHGWQPTLYCGLPGFLPGPYGPFTGYDPLTETWSDLVGDLLGDAALAARIRVFWYRYPSTLSPKHNGEELMRRLKASPRLPNGVGKVILVGHSMGGLVARAADAADVEARIGAIVTLGTPHDGAGLAEAGISNWFLPSPGLTSLRPGEFSRTVPMPTRAPLHAAYGELLCGNLLPGTGSILDRAIYSTVSNWFCLTGGTPPAGRGWTDGVVSRASATPSQSESVFPSLTQDLRDLFGDGVGHFALPGHPRLRAHVLATIRESLPADTVLTPLTRMVGGFGNEGILAEGGFIYGIARDQFGSGSRLMRVAANGGSTVALTPTLWAIHRWLADSNWIYFTQAEGATFPLRVKRVSRDGGTLDSLGVGLTGWGSFAQDDQYLYFNDYPGTNYNVGWAIRRIPKSGGVPEPVVSALPLSPFAVDGGYLYYAENGSGTVRRRRLSDGATTTLSTAFAFPQLGGVNMLVAEGVVILTKADTVYTLPATGGALVRRFTGAAGNGPIWVREGRLYLSDASGALVSMSLSDFTRTVRIFPGAGATGMDDRYFYLLRTVCCWSTELVRARR